MQPELVRERVLELEPGSDKARDTLRDLFVKARRWQDLEDLFGRADDFGRLADEETLYSLAGQLEQARPWFQRRPPSA